MASAFTLAFQVPNLFRRLLGEGALTAAFIPIFKQKEVKEGENEMWRSANAVICGLVAAAGAVTVLAVLVISWRCGRAFRPSALMLQFLRMMFRICCWSAWRRSSSAWPTPAAISLSRRWARRLNVVMIASVLLLAPRMGGRLEQQIFGLAIGVLVAGLAQAFFQFPACARRLPLRVGFALARPHRTRGPAQDAARLHRRGRLPDQRPGDPVFSFWFDESIVSTFNYAVRLMELPQGMFGISLATYLLPTLAGLAAEKKFPEFRQTLSQGLCYLAFANLIAAAISLALAEPIVRLLFERGKFGPGATTRVALALACLAPGLLMFSMNNILARAFYALNDIKTPMKISVFCLGLNLGVCHLAGATLPRGRPGGGQHFERDVEPGAADLRLAPQALAPWPGGLVNTLLVLVPAAVLAGLVAAAAGLALGEAPRPRHAAAQAGHGFCAGGVACCFIGWWRCG